MDKPYRRSKSLAHFILTSKVGDTYAHTLPMDGPVCLSEVNSVRQHCSNRVTGTIHRKGLAGRFTTTTEVILLDGEAIGVTVIKRVAD